MEWLLDLGYFGLFIGALLAATIIPFSSDFLLVGMLAAGGNVVVTVIVASLGNWAGGMISYWMGHAGRWEWIERWFKVKPETLEKQKSRIDRWGAWLAFLSWLPLVGDLFALGLGFYKVNPWQVALFMLIGKTARFVGWAVVVEWVKPWFA
ncbi:MAG TPA: DedA family protein [Candidatus Rikenella faecigallinarum]|uniref:DedA family protein n=1 Tax=Candidatus Rikenella faecigallinarum TaxID=2838745 RepID=A0A9D1QE46_9BACT|nr:DedA family protein [Candidatus Rikenella faecigallinarum]